MNQLVWKFVEPPSTFTNLVPLTDAEAKAMASLLPAKEVSNLISFTNNEEMFTVTKQLLPEQFRKDENIFVDMDSISICQVLNYFRNARKDVDKALELDLERFNPDHVQLVVTVGSHRFYTTLETLIKLPYFKSMYDQDKKITDKNIDRDPLLFRKLLSHLRNPIRYDTDELTDELAFFGAIVIGQNAIGKLDEAHYALRRGGVGSVLYDFPQITFNKNTYRRPTQNIQNSFVIEGKVDGDDIIYQFNDERLNTEDGLRKMFLVFTTGAPIRKMTDIFDSIEFVIGSKENFCMNDYAEFIDARNVLLMKENIIQNMINGINHVTVPIRFCFCIEAGLVIPLRKLSAFEKQLRVNGYKLDQPLSLVVRTAVYDLDEGRRFVNVNHEYLYYLYEKLFSVVSENNKVNWSKLLDRDYDMMYMVIVVTDPITDERIKCNLTGTFDIMDRNGVIVRTFQINQHSNQISQSESNENIFKSNTYTDGPPADNYSRVTEQHKMKLYDPTVWLQSWRLGPLELYQPSGSFLVKEGDTLKIDLKVDTPIKEVNVSAYFTYYDVLSIIDNECKLVKKYQIHTYQ